MDEAQCRRAQVQAPAGDDQGEDRQAGDSRGRGETAIWHGCS